MGSFFSYLNPPFSPKEPQPYALTALLPWGMLGKSKSLNDDTGMVVADGHLEEDRELIALEQYMGDACKQSWDTNLWRPGFSNHRDFHLNASWFKGPLSLSKSTAWLVQEVYISSHKAQATNGIVFDIHEKCFLGLESDMFFACFMMPPLFHALLVH